MKLRPRYVFPPQKQEALKKAVILEWISLFFLLTIIVVMYLSMGSSQAMKTAWMEDLLSLIPPIAFLVAIRYQHKQPTELFPYGYRRVVLLAFLAAAVAILILGLYMLYDSLQSLIKQHHPTLGHFQLFGTHWQIWSGWVMIAALFYSMIPPVVLGRLKLPLAKELHEKTLHADAVMNKADWMTAGAAILGILGIGLGWWWADAAAAGFIALDVVKDGFSNIKHAMADLMDQAPTSVGDGRPLDLAERVTTEVQRLPDVVEADVRLREEGHLISGEVFVVLSGQAELAQRIEHIADQASSIDWRLYNLVVTPVVSIR